MGSTAAALHYANTTSLHRPFFSDRHYLAQNFTDELDGGNRLLLLRVPTSLQI
jgi:hypothetical protein